MNLIARIFRLRHYLWYFISIGKINAYLSRAAVTSQLRSVDLTNPRTWEFSGFSQNGEDGIVDVLLSQILKKSKYSIEIGSNNGIDNCTAWLCIAKRYQSLMIEANSNNAFRAKYILDHFQGYHSVLNELITPKNINILQKYLYMRELDVFSIDIDSIDYYVAKAFLELGFEPKIIIAEYNSVFGPEMSLTVEYEEDFFVKRNSNKKHMYYWGVSLTGWKNLFKKYGYIFVTVDSCGVNSFFIKSKFFNDVFVENLKPNIEFIENFSTVWYSQKDWIGQFEEIKNLKFNYIT